MKRLNIIMMTVGVFYWTQVSCGPIGKRVLYGVLDCTLTAAASSATQIVKRLDDGQREWDGYVAATVAIRGGTDLLRCGLSHLLNDLDQKVASNSSFVPRRKFAVHERHRSRIMTTLSILK